MKIGLKITLIVLGVLVIIVARDTLQAKVFDNSHVPSEKELKEINNKIIDYFMYSNKDYDNCSFNYVDLTNNVVVVGLVNNSSEMQEEFRKKVVDSPYIKFIQGNFMQDYN